MSKIPVIILTGFLGSGKTTLLGEILKQNTHKKFSIIINEFGEVGLDHSIINQEIYHTQEKTMLLQGGCACCNKREDLIQSLRNILDKPIDYVIIETTGLANPAPILFSIQTDYVLQHHFFISQILTCVDCINAPLHLKNKEARVQIATSDKIIITKQDISPKSLQKTFKLIANHNSFAEILSKENLNFSTILDSPKNFDFSHNLKVNSQTLSNSHNNATHSLSINFTGILNWNAFCIWLSALLYKYGEDILRIKGILDTNDGYPVAINGVQHIIHPPTHLKEWNTKKGSEIVIIFRNLKKEQIIKSFERVCHIHNNSLNFNAK